MKVRVNNEGKIFIDEVETNADKLTSEILEKILEEGLEDNVTFDLPDDTSHPVASLFKELQELTLKDSDFRNKINDIIKEQQMNQQKLEIAESTELEISSDNFIDLN